MGALPLRKIPGVGKATERLLAAPLTLFHSRSGDAFDAISLFWLTRATGGNAVGVFYDMACYMTPLAWSIIFCSTNPVGYDSSFCMPVII